MSYHHTQPGTLNRVVIGAIIAADLVALPVLGADEPEVVWVMLAIGAIMVLVLALFHSLTVEIVRGELRIRFGVGLIRKRFAIGEIVEVHPIRTRWWYGWGIRLTPHGWLFNVSGFDAVKIELASGKKYLIGTDQPDRLRAAIESAMKRPS